MNLSKTAIYWCGKLQFFNIVEQYGLSLSFKENTVPEKLRKTFPKSYFAKFNKEAYNRLKADYNQSNRQNVILLYVLLIYGFNRMLRFNKKGDFNLPVGDVDFNQNTFNALEDYFSILANKHVDWFNLDYHVFLENIDFQENDLVYLDPPYLITFSEYNKLWNQDTETDLLNVLDNLNAHNVRFAISNVTHYKGKINEIFLNWSAKYNIHPIKSNYISFNDNSIKKFNEVLVTNF